MLQDIQQQLEELQQSVEDSSEMVAQVQQLRHHNLELDRSCTPGLQIRRDSLFLLRCSALLPLPGLTRSTAGVHSMRHVFQSAECEPQKVHC